MSGVRCGPVSAGGVLEGKPVLVRGLGEGFAGRAGILLFAVIVRRLQLTFTVRHGSVPVGEAVQEPGDRTLLFALLCAERDEDTGEGGKDPLNDALLTLRGGQLR